MRMLRRALVTQPTSGRCHCLGRGARGVSRQVCHVAHFLDIAAHAATATQCLPLMFRAVLTVAVRLDFLRTRKLTVMPATTKSVRRR